MQAGRRYTVVQIVRWSIGSIVMFTIYDTIIVSLHATLGIEWLHLPWQPISLVGVAVAFYLGFKNNSSYDRLWEARKIWGGIVNSSRSFTVMVRDFINNEAVENTPFTEEELTTIRKRIVHRHVAWLKCLTIELRKLKAWEHDSSRDEKVRKMLGIDSSQVNYSDLKPYLSKDDYDYIMTKGNKSSHLLSIQSKDLMSQRMSGFLEHFRHLSIQKEITEFYTLQGKSERIKNFPFPRQYASMNMVFTLIFVGLLPLGMIDIFHDYEANNWLWIAIPFSVICSWVFWLMEMVGDYSENPFEGLHNDVPISSMARGIERDIRQMLDETDLPPALEPVTDLNILL